MKRLLIGLSLLLFNCEEPLSESRPPKEWKSEQLDLTGIDGLEKCKLFRVVTPGNVPNLYIVRCPNSNTTTVWNEQHGKQTILRQASIEDFQEQ